MSLPRGQPRIGEESTNNPRCGKRFRRAGRVRLSGHPDPCGLGMVVVESRFSSTRLGLGTPRP